MLRDRVEQILVRGERVAVSRWGPATEQAVWPTGYSPRGPIATEARGVRDKLVERHRRLVAEFRWTLGIEAIQAILVVFEVLVNGVIPGRFRRLVVRNMT